MTRKKLSILMSIIFIVVFGFVSLPFGVSVWNKLEPSVLGLSLAQFTIIAVCIFFCIFYVVWYLLDSYYENKENKEEENKRGGEM